MTVEGWRHDRYRARSIRNRASRRAAVGALVLLTAACTTQDPGTVADGYDWPSSWDLVLATEDSDPSCGEVGCPTSNRYYRVQDQPSAACSDAAERVGAEPTEHRGGCTLDRCEDDVFVTVSVTADGQRVQEGVEDRVIEAPPGGAAVAVRARAGC
jgi:hypothetical protein